MELRHLSYFITLAETLNYTRAAGLLYISQSALSQQIVDLERELDTTLFYRTKRTVELTEQGRLFLDEARKVLRQVEQMTVSVRESSSHRDPSNSILIGLEIGTLHVSKLRTAVTSHIFSLREKKPGLQANVLTYEHNTLVQALENHSVDLGFFVHYQPMIKNKTSLTSRIFHRDEMVLAVCTRKSLTDNPETLKNVLLHNGIVLLEKEERGMYQAMRILEELQLEPPIHFASSRPAMILAVETGERTAIIPSDILEEIQNPHKQILHFDVPSAALNYLAVWQPGNKNPLIGDVVGTVRRVYGPDLDKPSTL